MDNRHPLRFFLLALFVAAVTVAVGACDSSGGGGSAVVRDSMQIINVSPELGADLATTDVSFTFTFTAPVVENEYTRTDVEPNSGNRHLVDAIGLYSPQAKSHDLAPVELSFNDDRTELTVDPDLQLQDGFIYTLRIGNQPDESDETGTGFYDPRFKSQDGARFAENPNYPAETFEFSIGLSEEEPTVPSVSFDSESGIVTSDAEIREGSFDYNNSEVTVPLQIDRIDDSAAEVKGYEVYYRSQNQVGPRGETDRFVKAFSVRPEANSRDFEDHAGIIPANAVESDGDLDFTFQLRDHPFSTDEGSYGPIEWKVRAVSINNVRSDFTDVTTTGDNTMPELEDAFVASRNESGEDESLVLRFSEALDSGTVSTSAFTVRADNEDLSLAETNLENVAPDRRNVETTVELTLATPTDDVDEVVVNDAEASNPVTDLAGNGVNPFENRETTF